MRRATAEHLAQHLSRGDALVARAEQLASAKRGDRIAPLNVAPRLILANARVAQALAQIAQVERGNSRQDGAGA